MSGCNNCIHGDTLMDWIAGILELTGDWTVGNKRKFGFILKFLGSATWIYVAITRQVYGLLLVCIPILIVHVRNYFKWRYAEKNKTINIEQSMGFIHEKLPIKC